MERGCPYLYTGSKFRVIWPSVLIIQGGGCNNPTLGKYVWEKPSREQGLIIVLPPLSFISPTLCDIYPRPTKGVTIPPLTVCLRPHKNVKQSDPGHLWHLFYILCGHFDEKKKKKRGYRPKMEVGWAVEVRR